MRTVRVNARSAASADAAFDGLSRLDSAWRVPFRDDAIRWTQRCEPSPDQRRITFAQIDGDFANLSGAWQLTPTVDGCEVLFELTYDVGVPIYDRILDPLIERTVADTARTIISGLG